MNKINKTIYIINYSLLTLIILAFGLIAFSTIVSAEGGYNYNYTSGYSNQYDNYPNTPTYTPPPTPIYIPIQTEVPVYIPTPTPTKINSDVPEATTYTDTSAVKAENSDNTNLASNVIFGSDGIFPSSLIGWIILAIIVLLIVILIRRISGGREKYFATELKHE